MDDQVDIVGLVGCGGYLAAVDAGVLGQGVLQSDDPVVGVRGVEGLEPLVRGVRVATHRQQRRVAETDPRDLEKGVPEIKKMAAK